MNRALNRLVPTLWRAGFMSTPFGDAQSSFLAANQILTESAQNLDCLQKLITGITSKNELELALLQEGV